MTRGDRIALALAAIVTVTFLVIFTSRRVSVVSSAGHDDFLFAWEGFKLASGSWLGAYNNRTLIKGIGFPLFLALGFHSGLPFPLALGIFMAACSAYFGYVSWRIWKSVSTACAAYAALLLTPALFGTLRVIRDPFYAGLTVALFASILHLLFGESRHKRRISALFGAVAAVFWLTREEGLWIAPALGLLAGAKTCTTWRVESWTGAKQAVVIPLSVGLGVFALSLLAVSTINLAVYGQFTLNEVKGGPFQSAMVALQRAAYPDWRPYVPVPKAARERIYEVSPTFRRLRPYLDSASAPGWAHQATCNAMPKVCGDVAGGWFLWYFRDAAAEVGAHASATKAAAFYRELAFEVNTACQDGRLTCAPFMLPLLPPATKSQIPDFLASALRAFQIVSGDSRISTQRMSYSAIPSNFDLMLRVLNNPPAAFAPALRADIEGLISAPTDLQTKVIPKNHARIVETRGLSAEDPERFETSPHRFKLVIECLAYPCQVALQSNGTMVGMLRIRPGDLQPGRQHMSGGVELSISKIDILSFETMRDKLAEAALSALPSMQFAFIALNTFGVAAFAGLAALAVVRRSGSLHLIVAASIAIAVATRVLLIAFINATSFPAVNNTYLLPATLLTAAFSVIAIAGIAEEVGPFRRSRSL